MTLGRLLSFEGALRGKRSAETQKADKRPALSVDLLQKPSKELFTEFRAARQKAKERPGDERAVHVMLAAFEKWARRARQGGVSVENIDYIFEEMCDWILRYADNKFDPLSLAHFAVLLDHARYATEKTAQKFQQEDIAVLSENARRDAQAISPSAEAAVEGVLCATQMKFDTAL